jgi:hypothetical protein
MPPINPLQYPVLEVSVNGTVVDKRPSSFTLITAQGFPVIMSKLLYPIDGLASATGDSVTVSLIEDEETSVLFTGEIYDSKPRNAYYELSLTDDYKKLHDTTVINAYRKETAKVILQDTLDAAGITATAITCPAITLFRFSTDCVKADMSINLFIRALEQHGESGLQFFFDSENIFRFGTIDDTGKNEGIAIVLETGKNIIKRGEGWVETLPMPVRHSQTISIDGKPMETIKTELIVSPHRSRLILWVKGV